MDALISWKSRMGLTRSKLCKANPDGIYGYVVDFSTDSFSLKGNPSLRRFTDNTKIYCNYYILEIKIKSLNFLKFETI
jgi:hypothetical protein